VSDVEINKTHWESMAGVHGNGTDEIYDVEALLAGGDSRTAPEREAIAAAAGGLAGKRIMHLQSHIGFDAISMAALGAEVTAVDFSPAALAKAEDLASRRGVEIATVESEATSLPAELDESFDVVYANLGAICWIEDLSAWMRAAAGALVPGGAVALVDLHPMGLMFEGTDPVRFGFPYANQGRFEETQDGSYADPDADVEGRTVVFSHSLEEIFTSARGAGLDVEQLREHLEVEFDCWGGTGGLAKEDDGLWRIRVDGFAVPILFTLIARKRA